MARYGVVGVDGGPVLFLNELPVYTSVGKILDMMSDLTQDGGPVDEYEYFDSRFMARNIAEDLDGLEDWPFDYTLANGFLHVDSQAQFEFLPRTFKTIYKGDLVVLREGLIVGSVEIVVPSRLNVPPFDPRALTYWVHFDSLVEPYQSRCYSDELIVIWKGTQHRLNDDICALSATCRSMRACVDAVRGTSGVKILKEGFKELVMMKTGVNVALPL